MFFRSYGDRVGQSFLLPKMNEIASQLSEASFDNEGICSLLSNIYIQEASQGRRESFFASVQLVTTSTVNSSNLEKLKPLYYKLKQQKKSYSIVLRNQVYLDTFSFGSNNLAEFKSNISKVITHLQYQKKDRYVHVTLAYIHSFVIEQNFSDSTFSYRVYDPNNPRKPRALFEMDGVFIEINNVVKRIKYSEATLKYLFKQDNGVLLTCYVYAGTQVKEEKGLGLITEISARVENKIKHFFDENETSCAFFVVSGTLFSKPLTSLLDNCNSAYVQIISSDHNQLHYIEKGWEDSYWVDTDEELANKIKEEMKLEYVPLTDEKPSCCLIEELSSKQLQAITEVTKLAYKPRYNAALNYLYEINRTIQQYQANMLARGVLLSNLLVLFDKLYLANRFVFPEEEQVKQHLSHHLLSSDFLKTGNSFSSVVYFSYDRKLGGMTLLHEVARLGDLKAVEIMMSSTSPLHPNNSDVTPIECAMSEGAFSIVRLMLNCMGNTSENGFFVGYFVDYEKLRASSFRFANAYSRYTNNFDGEKSVDVVHRSLQEVLFEIPHYKNQFQGQKPASKGTTSVKKYHGYSLFKSAFPIAILSPSAAVGYIHTQPTHSHQPFSFPGTS